MLGQLASGALLIWLGWQTLALRWALTPPSVRTPITWPQVQQRTTQALGQVTGYFQGHSVRQGIAAMGGDLRLGLTQLRHRIAGPRGLAAGNRPPISPGSPAQATSPTPAAHPATIAPATAPAADTDRVLAKSGQRRDGLRPAKGHRSFPGLHQLVVLKDWSLEILQGFRKPKPQRAMIDIPPRPPSIPRGSSTGVSRSQPESGSSEDKTALTTPGANAEPQPAPPSSSPRAAAPPPPLPDDDDSPASSTPIAPDPDPPEPEEDSNWPG